MIFRAPAFRVRRLCVAGVMLALGGTCVAAPPRTVPHVFGETTIEGTPERVLTLYQGATDTAVALGIEPVGVVDSWIERPMYRYLRDDLRGVTHVGLETQPSLEGIAWLRPDLIVATSHRHRAIRGLLSEIAPTVAHDSPFDFKGTLELMGRATGRADRARALLRGWHARVSDFRRRIARTLGDAWPQEVAVIEFKSDHARVYYTGFAGSILGELGFRRPPSHTGQGTWGIKLTNRETIPSMNADALFVIMNTRDPAVRRNHRRWTSHPLWQALDAVRNGHVYRVDPATWHLGGGIIAAHRMLDDLYARYGLHDPSRGGGTVRP